MESLKLLDEVAKDRLEKSMDDSLEPAEKDAAFKDAMSAIDRVNEAQKQQDSVKNQKKQRWVDVAVGAVVPLVVIGLKHLSKTDFLKKVCKIEEIDILTTTPGRSIKDFFRHD